MKELRSYLLENIEELKSLVCDIACYNGSLSYLEVFENDEYTINELFSVSAYEALRSSYYGSYDFNDSLVRFNSYGNLESLSEYEYEEEIKGYIDDIISELLDVYNEIDISKELEELIENVLNEEE